MGSAAMPGTVFGHLEQRVGDFAPGPAVARGLLSASAVVPPCSGSWRGQGVSEDPLVRQDLARLHTMASSGGQRLRLKAAKQAGADIPACQHLESP